MTPCVEDTALDLLIMVAEGILRKAQCEVDEVRYRANLDGLLHRIINRTEIDIAKQNLPHAEAWVARLADLIERTKACK